MRSEKEIKKAIIIEYKRLSKINIDDLGFTTLFNDFSWGRLNGMLYSLGLVDLIANKDDIRVLIQNWIEGE